MKDPGLRVKLDFEFDTDGMEDLPVLDFTVPDPEEKVEEIKVVKKPRRTKKKKGKELF